ncbi:MAG: ATP-binding protein [Gammaproteobacteria bacterium PRO9]|nr:ATP-binding protein [Gammaproteobacteria bacterium PRO9]
MQDYEKAGAFYLGRRWLPAATGSGAGKGGGTAAGSLSDELVLYESPDLTTHAVIIGMTGSGKTGLGISLLEESLIDGVPVIAIDPKGDLGNLLLTFPELRPADFEPWVDPGAAASAGQSVSDFAAAEAARWRKGLADWGQAPERIARLKAAADFAIYTPGSTAGRLISMLGSFGRPPEQVANDPELYREHLSGLVTGLLALIDIDADPLTSRDHILLSAVLDHQWQAGATPDLPALIGAVQHPGMAKIGVLDTDTFYPPKERFRLAMQLNNLLAAPGFQAWMEGEPLDAGRLLFTPEGKPRVSVLSIAHLDNTKRMFFVTLLLNAVVAWMRSQPGTSSLRAILYMDEVAGYLPPVAMPPSKGLMLTLLKQARAFGVGVVLATQNPADLDYKALSNAGSWFIGRLQTNRDRERVSEGLKSAAAGLGAQDAMDLDATLAGLGKRTFLMHNVHAKGPLLMQTRWAMAYLRGPLTRDDIRRLAGTAPTTSAEVPAAPPATPPVAPPVAPPVSRTAGMRPVVPPGVPERFETSTRGAAAVGVGNHPLYQAHLLGLARVGWVSTQHGIDVQRDLGLSLPVGPDTVRQQIDWRDARPAGIDLAALGDTPLSGVGFAAVPPLFSDAATVKFAGEQFSRWLRTECTLVLKRSPLLKLVSNPDESEADFHVRLEQAAKAACDKATAELRDKCAREKDRLEEQLRKAGQALEREKQQATGSKIGAALSIGSAVLGMVLGRRKLSASSTSRMATAIGKAGNMQKEAGDVSRATETVAQREAALQALDDKLQQEIGEAGKKFDVAGLVLEDITLRPKATDINVRFCGLAWLIDPGQAS